MKNRKNNWSWWMVLLWAYTTLISLLLGIIMVFFPAWSVSGPPVSATETVISGIIVFFPQIIFLILIGIKNFKK